MSSRLWGEMGRDREGSLTTSNGSRDGYVFQTNGTLVRSHCGAEPNSSNGLGLARGPRRSRSLDYDRCRELGRDYFCLLRIRQKSFAAPSGRHTTLQRLAAGGTEARHRVTPSRLLIASRRVRSTTPFTTSWLKLFSGLCFARVLNGSLELLGLILIGQCRQRTQTSSRKRGRGW